MMYVIFMFMIWIWKVPFSAHFVPSHVLLSVPHSRSHHMSHEMTHPFTHSLSRAHVPFHVLLSVPHSMSPPGSHHMLHNISRTVSIPMSYWLSHIPCLITCPMKSPILCPCTRVPLPYPILCPMSMSHSHIPHSHANFLFNVIVFFNSYSNVFYIDWTHKCPKKCIGQAVVYDRQAG